MKNNDDEKIECKGCHVYFYIENMEKSGTLCIKCSKKPKEAFKKDY